jgi:hypothetical protein
MRKLIVQVCLCLVVVGIGYLALFQRDAVMALFQRAKLSAKGYKPARTPQEALDRFTEAIKDRDYEAAATYCDGDYSEQVRKAAPGARALGKAIDDLKHNMDQEGVKSDKVKFVLALLEPFPRSVKVLDMKTRGDAQAFAVIAEEDGGRLRVDGNFEDWRLNPQLLRALVRGLQPTVELRRVGEGDNAHWKILFPVTPDLRNSVAYLQENGSNYARALDKVKYALKRDAATKSDLERELRYELEEAGR